MVGLNRYQRKIIKEMVLNGKSGPKVRERIDDFINQKGRQRNKKMVEGSYDLNVAFIEWLAEQEYYHTAEFLAERVMYK